MEQLRKMLTADHMPNPDCVKAAEANELIQIAMLPENGFEEPDQINYKVFVAQCF